jgi:hypothetical protein
VSKKTTDLGSTHRLTILATRQNHAFQVRDTFPASNSIDVHGDSGVVDTVPWTPADPVIIAAFSAAGIASNNELYDFVPDSARGWRVTFPGVPGAQAQPTATPTSCTPNPT